MPQMEQTPATEIADLPHSSPTSHRRRWRLDLESPLLSLPAVLVVICGFFLPLGVLAVYSFWPTVEGVIVHNWTFENYARFFEHYAYWHTLLQSSIFVGIASALTVGLTFPFAYFVATKVRPERRLVWIVFAVLPFWTSYLIRVFAWMNLLGEAGAINHLLTDIGMPGAPFGLFGNNKDGIVITFVYLMFPLSFLTSYITIERMNPAMLEAAADLGGKPWQALMRITVPVARMGLIAGFIFCFISMMGDYVTPQLIGGTEGFLYSTLITNQFGSSIQWGFGAALALIFAVAVFVLLLVMKAASGGTQEVGEYTRAYNERRAPFLRLYSIVFLIFLYVPIGILILLAFNSSNSIGFPIRGLTTHWFAGVFEDPLLIESLETSLIVAATAVATSVVLGTLAAIQLSRSRGRLRSLSLGILTVPLFLPPLLLGLAIIIGLNAIGVERGLWTIILGHVLLTLPIVTLMVVIRLEGLDRNQELAAADLGARPLQALLRVSIPQAAPGIIAAALIAFAVSMDEFILTYLVTGTNTTLPLYIFGALRFSLSPSIAALSVLLLGFSFLLVICGLIVATAGSRRNRRNAGSAVAAVPMG